jgi:Preprotein translocase subunit Sec62
MTPVSWPFVVAVAVVALLCGFFVSGGLVITGHSPLIITPWMGVLFLVIAVVLFAGGIGVKHLKSGRRTNTTALQAARVAAFARSCLLCGAGFSGFLAGVAGIGLFRLWASAMQQSAIYGGIAFLGAIIMTIVAVIVERWCIDDGTQDKAGAS